MFHNTRLGRKVFKGDLQEGENIIYVAHVHTYVLLRDAILYVLIGIMIPIALSGSVHANNFTHLVGGIVAICSFIRFYLRFILWYFDCWVITDKAVIDYFWSNIFSKKVIRMEYDTLEGIAHEVKGFWNTILNKGKIQLLKHSDHNDVTLFNASNPKHIEHMILQSMKAHEASRGIAKTEKHEMIQTLLAEMLADYAQGKGIDLGK
ncbi:MAG: hypothetical protein ACK4NC_00710 [Candidatus Gracilibacteria bacterium]